MCYFIVFIMIFYPVGKCDCGIVGGLIMYKGRLRLNWMRGLPFFYPCPTGATWRITTIKNPICVPNHQ